MALVKVPSGGLLYPGIYGTDVNQQEITLNAAGEIAAGVMQVSKTGKITKGRFLVDSYSVSASVDLRLETVSASTGEPTGTLKATDTRVDVTVSSTFSNNEGTFVASYDVTQGEVMGVVAKMESGSPGDFGIVRGQFPSVNQFPYCLEDTTGSYVKIAGTGPFVLGYDDGTWTESIILTTFSTWQNGINVDSSPDEMGNVFQVPWPCEVSGFACEFNNQETVSVVLYEGSTELTKLEMDADIASSKAQNRRFGIFPDREILRPGVDYRITIRPEGTTNVNIPTVVGQSASGNATWGGGSTMFRTQRTNAGSWTEFDVQRIEIDIWITAFDDGTGPGIVNRNAHW